MAASINLHRKKRGYRQVAEINVTPFVDVMLVLLVVFMITAPLLTVAVPIDLPKSTARALPQTKEPLVVSISKDGKVYLQDTPINLNNLVTKLKAISKSGQDTRIFVRADKAIAYGRVLEIMGTINAGGFNKVALVSELLQPTASAP